MCEADGERVLQSLDEVFVVQFTPDIAVSISLVAGVTALQVYGDFEYRAQDYIQRGTPPAAFDFRS